MENTEIDLNKEYEIKFDINLLAEMIAGEKSQKSFYSILRNTVDINNFLKRLLRGEKMIVRLFSMNGIEQSREVEKVFTDNGYQPSKVTELLMLQALYPETKMLQIAAIGSARQLNDCDYYSSCTKKDPSGWFHLSSTCFEDCCLYKTSKEYYFLGTKTLSD